MKGLWNVWVVRYEDKDYWYLTTNVDYNGRVLSVLTESPDSADTFTSPEKAIAARDSFAALHPSTVASMVSKIVLRRGKRDMPNPYVT